MDDRDVYLFAISMIWCATLTGAIVWLITQH
jgi:hypothetical protein